MKEYHKIQTLWARESAKPHNMILGEFALPEFEALQNITWVATEKIDGTNVRVFWDGHNVSFGGKTDDAQMPVFLFDRLQELFGGEANAQVFEQAFGESQVCLYGEGYGHKIQKVGHLYGDVDFILFDVRVGDWWLERRNIEDVAGKFDIDIVPIVEEGTLYELSDLVKHGFPSMYGDLLAEGIVAKPKVELFNRKGERIITKLKHRDFVKLERQQKHNG